MIKDEKYYESMLELFLTDGWKALVERAEAFIEVLTERLVSGSEGADSDNIIRGQISVYRELASLESSIPFMMEQLKAEQEE